MHELSIATPLLSIVLDELLKQEQEQGSSLEVTLIKVQVGVLVDLEIQTLQGCFGILAEGTKAASAVLKIEKEEMQGYCANCKQKVSTSKRFFSCPFCHNNHVDWQGGREMYIASITVQAAVSPLPLIPALAPCDPKTSKP